MNMYENLQKEYMRLKDQPCFQYLDLKRQYELRNLSKEERKALFMAEKQKMDPYMERYENLFVKIPNFEESLFDMNGHSEHVVIQEKIDGSNAHLNVDGPRFQCFGNNYILNEQNHLQGFWFWCREHYHQVPEMYYGLDIYGEWLVPHHCQYPAERYGEFYVYDVMENGEYWDQDRVRMLAADCGFTYVPVFYDGPFLSWKHVLSFVGRTELGGAKGEGVVLKNQVRLNHRGTPFYVKIVDTEFQETNRSRQVIKAVSPDMILKMENQRLLSESIVTVPRVRKMILKLIDERQLPSDWKVMEDKELTKILKSEVYRDCLAEERTTVESIGGRFGKYCAEYTLQVVQELRKSF